MNLFRIVIDFNASFIFSNLKIPRKKLYKEKFQQNLYEQQFLLETLNRAVLKTQIRICFDIKQAKSIFWLPAIQSEIQNISIWFKPDVLSKTFIYRIKSLSVATADQTNNCAISRLCKTNALLNLKTNEADGRLHSRESKSALEIADYVVSFGKTLYGVFRNRETRNNFFCLSIAKNRQCIVTATCICFDEQ